jgi:hypothetical protein
MPDRPALPFLEMLRQEYRQLHGAEPPAAESGPAAFYRAALAQNRTALCLSGGGIRSACFALGVLQGLARLGLLGRFDYLSTVSGGGYVGAWLTAWRQHRGDDTAVFAALAGRQEHADRHGEPFAEPPELQGLRRNSNFLTPKLGATSGDSWTVAALCLRNLVLNWTIFGPLMLALVLVPQGAALFLGWASDWGEAAHVAVAAIGVAALFLALLVTAANRPLNRAPGAASSGRLPPPFGRAAFGRRTYVLWVLLPTYLAATLLAVFAVSPPGTQTEVPAWLYRNAAILGFGVYAAAWLIPALRRRPRGLRLGDLFAHATGSLSPAVVFVCWMISGLVASLMAAFGLLLYRHYGLHNWAWLANWQWETLASFGVAWLMACLLVADLLFTGLTSYAKRSDLDREWSGRSSGALMLAGLAWPAFSAVVLFGPAVVGIGRPDIDRPFASMLDWANGTIALAGGFSGLVTMALGASSKTAAVAARKWIESHSLGTVLSVATLVFLLCLTILLSAATSSGLLYVQAHLGLLPRQDKLATTVLAALLCFGLGAGASFFVNVNRFSLHDIYRNRLIRAFLGSARGAGERDRDPFTGFGPEDNLRMAALLDGPPGHGPLYPVVNMTLNLVSGDNLAWQERKAESFTATPLHCGSPSVGYRPTRRYGGTLSLGTAMAISGAAASPNQGYHSSPIIGLVMMLLNVRLGWWLGNPAKAKRVWRRDGPRWSFVPALREMLGMTDNSSRWVYLSDGGHFDNLGVYEMLRRRCRLILVSDAGCDPACGLADLGGALRKAWIDLGVKVEFDSLKLKARQAAPEADGVYAALARIHYPEAPEVLAHLVYLKPSYLGTEPADIRAYAQGSPAFPHESTADQWFSESQMESYRALGDHVVTTLAGRDALDPVQMVARVRAYLRLQPEEVTAASA